MCGIIDMPKWVLSIALIEKGYAIPVHESFPNIVYQPSRYPGKSTRVSVTPTKIIVLSCHYTVIEYSAFPSPAAKSYAQDERLS